MESMSSREGGRNQRWTTTKTSATHNSQLPRGRLPTWELGSWELGVLGRSGGMKADTFIQAAHPIPLRVHRHVIVAKGAQLANDTRVEVGLERTRQLVATDFHARDCVMVA